ncbi:pantetheinase-like [Saccostrea echinata]|uniref:pantetheinase-like n=1 Tax=Saccostrea echinata TaxID=191078 RepID=UPI002A83A5F4|nr:pantetheinase-like [Saccostrea echinata]
MLLAVTLLLTSLVQKNTGFNDHTFRGAVFEYAPSVLNRTKVVSRAEALKYMRGNLLKYKEIAEEASRKLVDIIVFPEDGITHYWHTRQSARSYLEFIPDPKKEKWNSCNDPHRYPNTEVQHFLSCLAKNNSLYLVANIGDVQPCNHNSTSKTCPSDGHFQYNTDVVYDGNGMLIAKYHKINLFHEHMYDPSTSKEVVHFQTPFGTFAVFTCFDVMFRNPTEILLREQGIRNVVFPTGWMDVLPFLAAIEFHSAVAAGFGVNYLAANLHIPEYRFQGSGIYSPNGALAYYYNSTVSSKGKLLIADVPILDNHPPYLPNQNRPVPNGMMDHNIRNPPSFRAVTNRDFYNYVALDKATDHVRVCHNKLCCIAYYTTTKNFTELFALAAYDGLHSSYYIQVCGIVKCKTYNRSSCGEGSKTSTTFFSHLSIQGTFTTDFVFPEILLYGNGSFQLSPPGNWSYNSKMLQAPKGFDKPLVTFSMFSRDYSRDRIRTVDILG